MLASVSDAGEAGAGTATNGQRYESTKQRIVAVTHGFSDDLVIAATPDWTVLDLLAHLDGVATDVAAGDVSRYAQPEWTHEQIQRRRGQSRAQLLAAWDQSAGVLAPVLDDPVAHGLDATFGVRPLLDVLSHEQDLRSEAGLQVRVGDDWPIVAKWRQDVLNQGIGSAELPPLEVMTPEGDRWLVGGEEPAATVTAQRHELWRSLEGRRTRAQVRAFDWSANPDPYLEIWTGLVFRWPDGG
jgi:uncharacterized protein (TIGR03083 family)